MAEAITEISCATCVGACCIGPRTLPLKDHERDQIVEGGKEGTTLWQIVGPTEQYRHNAPFPSRGMRINQDKPEEFVARVRQSGVTNPLQAHHGLYLMLEECGNLVEVDGMQQCGIYDERPEVCRAFQEGSADYIDMRAEMGVGGPTFPVDALYKHIRDILDT